MYTCWHSIKASSWWFMGVVCNEADGDGNGEMIVVWCYCWVDGVGGS